MPWAALVEIIAPYYPQGRTGRPPFSLETMLRTHFTQQWFTLSDPATEEAFFDTPLYRWKSTSSLNKSWPPSIGYSASAVAPQDRHSRRCQLDCRPYTPIYTENKKQIQCAGRGQ